MDSIKMAAASLTAQAVPFALNEPMSRHTSFQIGGPAAIFCAPQNIAQLQAALQAAKQSGVRVYLLGEGTNVLFCDEGYPGMVVQLCDAFASLQTDGLHLTAGAGCRMQDVCTAAAEAGLAGLEFAYGIPGRVAGGIYMNAGAFGGEMRQVLESVRYLDETFALKTIAAPEMQLGYRDSVFQRRPWCIVEASFCLQPGSRNEIEAAMQQHWAHRSQKQPLDVPSAGSAFKRPEGAFAGALIDQSGLRGHRVGNAAISEKHCGFIVNLGGATCADVLALAEQVAGIVHDKTGFVLEKEIRVVDADVGLVLK